MSTPSFDISENSTIKEAYLAGLTLDELGKGVGLTRERIRQIIQSIGISNSEKEQHYLNRDRRKKRLWIKKAMSLKMSKFGSRSGLGGNYWEKRAYKIFHKKGYQVIIFGGRSLLDFIVNGFRVDVKGSFKISETGTFQFRARERQRKYVEFFVVCFDYQNVEYNYIIPSYDWNAECIRINPLSEKSKYKKYRNAWDLLEFSFKEDN